MQFQANLLLPLRSTGHTAQTMHQNTPVSSAVHPATPPCKAEPQTKEWNIGGVQEWCSLFRAYESRPTGSPHGQPDRPFMVTTGYLLMHIHVFWYCFNNSVRVTWAIDLILWTKRIKLGFSGGQWNWIFLTLPYFIFVSITLKLGIILQVLGLINFVSACMLC